MKESMLEKLAFSLGMMKNSILDISVFAELVKANKKYQLKNG